MGFIIIPDKVVELTKATPRAALQYGKILFLARQEGFCYASMSFLADYLGVKVLQAKKLVKVLEGLELIRVEREKGKTNKIIPLVLCEKTSMLENTSGSMLEDTSQSKTSMLEDTGSYARAYGGSMLEHTLEYKRENNIENKESVDKSTPIQQGNKNGDGQEKKKRVCKKFEPPTEQEVIKYFLEKGYSADMASEFFDYYQVGDWCDGQGKQVKVWKQKVSLWVKREKKYSGGRKNNVLSFPERARKYEDVN